MIWVWMFTIILEETRVVTHRNRFGNVITCPRYVGNERVDAQWVNSEYCSVEAKDKSTNNSILTDYI